MLAPVILTERRCKAGVVSDSFGIVGRVESSVGDAPGVVTEGTKFAEGTHDPLGAVHLDDALVVLIADQGVTIPQAHRARGQRSGASRQVAVCTGTSEILPHDVLIPIDLDDAGVIGIRN